MTASQQQTPSRRADEFWRNPLLHLGACLAISALAILVILAIHLLT